MQCYKHREEIAIAICRHCGKAVCSACCDDTPQGVACGSDCATNLWDAARLLREQMRNYGIGARPPMPASVSTYFFFGLILLLVGLYFTMTQPGTDVLTLAMSAVFFVMSAGSYKRFRDGCSECGITFAPKRPRRSPEPN